ITSRTFDRFLLLAAPIFAGGAGIGLLLIHASTPVIAHSVGDYVPGLAIVVVSDTFTALMLVLPALVSLISCLSLIATEVDQYRLVTELILMMLTGAYGALLTGILLNFFACVKEMMLPAYALIAATGT